MYNGVGLTDCWHVQQMKGRRRKLIHSVWATWRLMQRPLPAGGIWHLLTLPRPPQGPQMPEQLTALWQTILPGHLTEAGIMLRPGSHRWAIQPGRGSSAQRRTGTKTGIETKTVIGKETGIGGITRSTRSTSDGGTSTTAAGRRSGMVDQSQGPSTAAYALHGLANAYACYGQVSHALEAWNTKTELYRLHRWYSSASGQCQLIKPDRPKTATND